MLFAPGVVQSRLSKVRNGSLVSRSTFPRTSASAARGRVVSPPAGRQFHVVDFPPVPRSPHVRPTLAFANLACALWLARSTNVESNSKTKIIKKNPPRPRRPPGRRTILQSNVVFLHYTRFSRSKGTFKGTTERKNQPRGSNSQKFAIFPNGNISLETSRSRRLSDRRGARSLPREGTDLSQPQRARRWCPARRRGRRGPRRRRRPGMGS